ncbi:helix-turn-helix domain-containing protein [Martelella radicis]|uniref:Transcriptional regulator with XRE-family HTH domain n=1 Tax=Martelella radicis TaxID=1397476 RepID=A0A7W6KMJ9_9HYPH|nr:XRE family transcriptional regulator [Martelella radicis]MBB4122600.1 transcriptional regulator with XRE-family HTH domain [Martelella radicis]
MIEPDVLGESEQSATSSVARILSELRRENGWTLAEVSKRTGVSISALSKIENGQSQPAYSVLTRLSSGLGLDFADLLEGKAGRPSFARAARAITRKGEGKRLKNDMGIYRLLSTELAAKALTPMVIDIPPRAENSEPARSAHSGEEFVFVLSGDVIFEMEPYTPVVLAEGDTVYFDAASSHGFYSAGPGGARILSICYSGSNEAPDYLTV